jgi:hypothetical protein
MNYVHYDICPRLNSMYKVDDGMYSSGMYLLFWICNLYWARLH